MIKKKIFLTFSILIFSFAQTIVLANTADPFTRSLSDIKEQTVISQNNKGVIKKILNKFLFLN